MAETGFMLAPSPAGKAPVEPEPDLSDDDLSVLLKEGPKPAPKSNPGAEDAGDAEDGDEASQDSDGSPAQDDISSLRQDLARTQGALAALLRGQGASAAADHQKDPIETFTAKFFGDRYADIPDDTKAFFREYGKGLVDLVTSGVNQRLEGIERQMLDSSGKQVLQEFESQLDAVMGRAGLSDAEKEVFKQSVMMDGLRQFGNRFTTAQAIRLFREKHKKVLDARVDQQSKDEQELDNDQNSAPPPTRRGGNLAAHENVVGKLMKSGAPENTFGGSNWRKYIARRLKSAANGGA